jgi:hypothetical protein
VRSPPELLRADGVARVPPRDVLQSQSLAQPGLAAGLAATIEAPAAELLAIVMATAGTAAPKQRAAHAATTDLLMLVLEVVRLLMSLVPFVSQFCALLAHTMNLREAAFRSLSCTEGL